MYILQLEGDIYMCQCEGFVEKGKEHFIICKLIKEIYGLKQLGQVWYQTLSSLMSNKGIQRHTVAQKTVSMFPDFNIIAL